MKKTIALIALSLTALASAPSASDAARVRDCGNYGSNGWQSKSLIGSGIHDLTARGARCELARWFALNAFTKVPYYSYSWSAHGWTCYYGAATRRWTTFYCEARGSGLIEWSRVATRAGQTETPLIPCRPVDGVGVRKHGPVVCDTARSAARDFIDLGGRDDPPGYVFATSPLSRETYRLYLQADAGALGLVYRGRVDGQVLTVEISVP